MELRVLGPLELWLDGGPVALGGPRAKAVLAVLAVEANRVVPVDRLVDALWDEAPPATARGQIQICVSTLRRALGQARSAAAITTRAPGYALRITDDQLDVAVFDRLVASARRAADEGRPGDAADELRAALRLWRGPALAGMAGRVVRSWATRLEERRLAALEQRIDLDLALGRHADVIGELRSLVSEYPLREQLRAALMLALYRSGRQVEALDTYREARLTLVGELGIEPGADLRRMERAILARSPELDAVPAAVQAGRRRAPEVTPRQLPRDIADFTGRADLVTRITRTLRRDGGAGCRDVTGLPDRAAGGPAAVPVVAIAGPGGVGKSTLAVHVAHAAAAAYPDGQLHASLREDGGRPADPGTVLGRFLNALGVADAAVPDGPQERAQLYRSRTADRRILVVLDDAVDEAQVAPLLPGAGSCAVVVTSRPRLTGLAGALQVGVGVLDADTAVTLLARVAGAARVRSEDAAAATLAALCDGLPLALRIAGARLASRPHWRVSTMVDRLRDETRRLDELRHGDLRVRACISLSYEGLPAAARRLLRRLSLLPAPEFAGWAAAALLDTRPDTAEEQLDRLVDAQLVTAGRDRATGAVRYRLHDLVRVFARERLDAEEAANDIDTVRRRTLAALLWLAGEAHRREYGGDYTILHGGAPRWPLPPDLTDRLLERPLDWLEGERATLMAAVRHAAELGLDELCWDLALTSVTLFETRGRLDDWRDTTEVALAATRRTGNRRGEAAMLHALGGFHSVRQRYDEARELLLAARAAFTGCAETHGAALVVRDLAHLDRMRGDAGTALARYREAVAGLRAADDPVGQAHALCGMGALLLDAGDHLAAQKVLDEALVLCQVAGNRRVEAQVLHRLGELYLADGDLDRAAQSFHWVLRIVRDRGDRIGEAYGLHGLGRVRHRERHHDQAETALEQALLLARQIGERTVEGRALHSLGELRVDQCRHEEAERLLAAAHDVFTEVASPVWQARALVALGDAYAAQGRPRAAARAVVAAAGLLSTSDSPAARRLRDQLTTPRPVTGPRRQG